MRDQDQEVRDWRLSRTWTAKCGRCDSENRHYPESDTESAAIEAFKGRGWEYSRGRVGYASRLWLLCPDCAWEMGDKR